MVKKKVKGKKKSSARASPTKDRDPNAVDPSLEDPDTQMAVDSGTAGKKKKGKKKAKKPKLSKEEKALEKLNKAATLLQLSGAPYVSFLNHMDKWFKNNYHRCLVVFESMNTEESGLLTYNEFKSGMYDLAAPCSDVEIYLLAKLMDADQNDEIDFKELRNGLADIKERAEFGGTLDDDVPADELRLGSSFVLDDEIRLVPTQRKYPKCPGCNLGVCTPGETIQPKYVKLLLTFVTFEGQPHPGNFSITVHTHISIRGIIELIVEKTDTASSHIAVYKNKSRGKEALLQPNHTLKEYGARGSTLPSDAEEFPLYWDYKAEFIECPILMADHYFGIYPKTDEPVPRMARV